MLLLVIILMVSISISAESKQVLVDESGQLMLQVPDSTELEYSKAKSYCENLSLNDHQDWRLPDRRELKAASRMKKRLPSTTYEYTFWSSTPNPWQNGRMWVLLMLDGTFYSYSKTGTCNVLCVRTVK